MDERNSGRRPRMMLTNPANEGELQQSKKNGLPMRRMAAFKV